MKLSWTSLIAGLALGIAASAAAGVAPTAARAADLPIRFTLDWKAQGPHAWYYVARDKGYFKKEGLDVTIDQGEGSAAAVTRVVSGTYDAGFGDINALIQAVAQHPENAPEMVYLVYNRAPFAIIAKASGPIKTLKDLEGRTVAAPAGSATLKLFPALASKNGTDASKVKVLNASPNLIEQMLVRGDADAIAQFSLTSYMNFLAMGLDPNKDFRWFFYSDLGLDMYSNGIIVSHKLIAEHPKAVKGLVRAINRAIMEVASHPDEGIAELKKVEPLTNGDLEKKRLLYTLANLMRTPETAKIGLGDLSDARLASSIDTIATVYGLPSKPKVAQIFTRAYLPPKAERMLPPVK